MPWVYGALVLVQILFGINYVVSKIIVTAMPPLVWSSIRLFFATIGMFIVAWIWKGRSPKLTRDYVVPLIKFSLFGIIINQGCFVAGLKFTTPTNSALLNTLIPVFTLLFVSLSGQEKLTRARLMGFVLAFAGVLAIRKIEDFHLGNETLLGDLLTLINSASFGYFLAKSKDFMSSHDSFWATAWLFLFGSIGMAVVSIPSWVGAPSWDWTPELLGCVVYGILGATLATYFLNNWTLARAQSSKVAIFIYIQPLMAAGVDWFWRGESVALRTVVSSAVILLGVTLALTEFGRPGVSLFAPKN